MFRIIVLIVFVIEFIGINCINKGKFLNAGDQLIFFFFFKYQDILP